MNDKIKLKLNRFQSIFLDNIARWLLLGIVVGTISGLSASGFFYLLQLAKHYCMHLLAGYAAPSPQGEQLFEAGTSLVFHRFIFFMLPVVGGLLSGIIVYLFAPEAEGHGTDAMIDAFHNKKGYVRPRVPFVKAIATIITLASGGSAGREGPIAQIGAGLGSIAAGLLRLSSRERRILLLAGCGAGLAAIFRAPLGGAITAIEVLYREDMETEALIPTVVSSIIAYIIFTNFFGHQPVFYFPNYNFSDPRELVFYVILGLICIPMGISFIRFFYWIKNYFFLPLNIPRYFKPALGGLGVGLIGLAFPQVYGDGWGWIQLAILGKLTIGIMLAIALLKIIATSFTISSGGSGGVFGPSLFIGGMLGGAVGFASNHFYPDIVAHPGAFVVVGMASFFAGVANAPIGTLLMCSEMTQGYGLIAPLMSVSIIAILFTRKHSIYQNQVQNRLHSPAHITDFTINILAEMKVQDIYKHEKITPILKTMTYGHLKNIFSESSKECFPVYDEQGKLVGSINWDHTRPIVYAQEVDELVIAEDIMVPVETLTLDNNLYEALVKFLKTNQEELLVVEDMPPKVLGVLRHDDLIQAYSREVTKRKSEGEKD